VRDCCAPLDDPVTIRRVPIMTFSLSRTPACCALALALSVAAGCGGGESDAPPVATPTVTLNHDTVPASSPLEVTYKFTVADTAQINGDYRVLVHIVDADEEQMWTFDHDPPVPTSRWKPGQTIEYTHTEWIPVYPYVGEAAIHIGLYSTADNTRLPLNGDHVGQNAYRAARFQLLPQSDNLLMIYKDGWHGLEAARDNPAVEWQWTKKEATLAFKNPRKDAVFYLDVDSPGAQFHQSQQVEVRLGDAVVDQFTITSNPADRQLRKIALPAAQIGTSDMAELTIAVDNTFTPAKVNPSASNDPRELGVRVFHAFVDAR
jgi:hypothetical protein